MKWHRITASPDHHVTTSQHHRMKVRKIMKFFKKLIIKHRIRKYRKALRTINRLRATSYGVKGRGINYTRPIKF